MSAGNKGGSATGAQPQGQGLATIQGMMQPTLAQQGKTTQPAVQAPQATQSGIPSNPYLQASQGMQNSYAAIQQAMQQNQRNQPVTIGASQIPGVAQMGATGYAAAQQVQPGQIKSLINDYMNPYTSQVINSTAAQMNRDRQGALTQNKAAATAAGAFGGSRHGIVDAVTNAEINQNVGDMTANLRNQGFNTASGLASQDIANRMNVAGQNQNAINQARQYNAGNQFAANQQNAGWRNDVANQNANLRQNAALANQSALNNGYNQQFQNAMQGANALGNMSQVSFGMGNTLNQQQNQYGQQSQQLLQSILNAGANMFGSYAGQPEQLLNLRLASLGMNPLNNAGTTTGTQTQNTDMTGGLLAALGNMVQFAPIALSSKRFKQQIEKTGKVLVSEDGNKVDEVSFVYRPGFGFPIGEHIGIIAENLPPDDSALVKHDDGTVYAVDYSKLKPVEYAE